MSEKLKESERLKEELERVECEMSCPRCGATNKYYFWRCWLCGAWISLESIILRKGVTLW